MSDVLTITGTDMAVASSPHVIELKVKRWIKSFGYDIPSKCRDELPHFPAAAAYKQAEFMDVQEAFLRNGKIIVITKSSNCDLTEYSVVDDKL